MCPHCRSPVQIWSLDLDPSESRLAVGTSTPHMLVYKVGSRSWGGGSPAAASAHERSGGTADADTVQGLLHAMGSIQRRATERVVQLRYGMRGSCIFVQSAGKQLELFRCFTSRLVLVSAEQAEHVQY